MISHLKVMSPGLHTTVQDLGRFGVQDLGIPVAGALDPIGLRLANSLVGNAETAGALEIRLAGPTLRVEADSVRVALSGTETSVEIQGRDAPVPAWQSLRLCRGETLRIGAVRDTSCCYLAVEGGFDLPLVFGSQSTYLRGGFGGLEGRALREGDELPLVAESAPMRDEIRFVDRPSTEEGPVRVVLGPQDDYFEAGSLAVFLAEEFRVSSAMDRMGMRLEGPQLKHVEGHDIASDGIATGSIQVPGHGQPILLLADHQTTGGYPKIAVVVSADLPRVGRLKPGDRLRFASVSVGEAEHLRREQEAAIGRLVEAMLPVDPHAEQDLSSLLGQNLISGVVNAVD